MCFPKAFEMESSPFQNCEIWLVFQVLFFHMCLTKSTESEKFSRLGVVVDNSR